MRKVALLPGSESMIFGCPQWLSIQHDESSKELWVDYWKYEVRPDTRLPLYTKKSLKHYIKTHAIQKLVFFDIFHSDLIFEPQRIEVIKYFQELLPTTFVTICKHPIPDLKNVVHFDFYWNRCKQSYLDKKSGWKQLNHANFNQWQLNLNQRPMAVLSLYGTNNKHIKKHLYDSIHHISGYHGGFSNETVLPCETGETNMRSMAATPPARRFFDDTYISAQLESLIKGPNVIFCEKTYDHLIQGRFVLNFGPKHYYRTLSHNGWRLPVGINFDWDNLEDQTADWDIANEPRFVAYIDCLKKTAADQNALHELFMANRDVFEHNRQQLQQRPYDIFNLEQLDHK